MVNSLVTNLRAHSPWVHQASAGESSATPTLESCRNDPNRYAQAVEKHFGHNMAELCAHIAQRSESEQKAVIDGSKAFRAFLGIRNPNRLSRKLLPFGSSSSSSSSRISALDAPAALVMAATRSGDNGRVLRSLTRLRESLTEVKDKHRSDLPNGYSEFAEPVLDKLAQELGKLVASQFEFAGCRAV